MKNTKLWGADQAIYTDHVVPVVPMPQMLVEMLSLDEQQQLKERCFNEYREAKRSLNEAIADVAVNDARVLAFSNELAQRVLLLIDVIAELRLDQRHLTKSMDEAALAKMGFSDEAMRSRAQMMGVLNDLQRGNLRSAILSSLSHEEAGYVGLSPLAIQHAATGNLRESMYIAYRFPLDLTIMSLMNTDDVNRINAALSARQASWQLNAVFIEHLRQQLGADASLYQYGAYAASREGSRVERSSSFKKMYQEIQNPPIESVQRIPLSARETLAQTGELNPSGKETLRWLPGEAWYTLLDGGTHPSLAAAAEAGEVMLTGISGTTDVTLTLSNVLGMFDGDDTE